MKKILLILFILTCFKLNGQNTVINLIPQPVKLEQSAGFYLLTNTATIGYNHADAQKIAEMLALKLNVPTGYSITANQTKTANIQFNLNEVPDPQIASEGYTLNVDNKGVIISANQISGLYYGMQTLLQLLPKEIENKTVSAATWNIPNVKIMDYPRFAWRGIMLDVSRHFFTKEEVKTYIDQISKLKYNIFHWHLSDDNGWRIEIKSLPKLTEVGAWRVERFGHFGDRANPKPGEPATYGGFYTQDDIREIIEFAKVRNVSIIPEIDVPGHSMAALAAYPELSCTKDKNIKVNPGTEFAEWFANGKFKMLIDNTLNPADEKVYEFLDKVFTEVAALFPAPYIHVGGDECYKGYWEKNAACQALMKKNKMTHVEQLQGYFMNRLQKILNAKGKKLLGWDEILEGGISPDATVMSWRGIKGGIEAAKMGHEVVMTPTTFAYLDYIQGDKSIEPPVYASLRAQVCYSFEPVPEGVDAKYILGGQGNLWTEQIPTFRQVQYMTYPRSWALAEVYWSPKETKNWDNFTKRMENHFERADLAEINYSKAVYDPIIKTDLANGKLTLNMEAEISDLEIFYTIDGTMPDNFSPKYTKPVLLPEGKITLRAITYRKGKPMGHLIILKRDELEKRAKK